MSLSESVPPNGASENEAPKAGAARLIEEQESKVMDTVPGAFADTPTIATSGLVEICIIPVALKGTPGRGAGGKLGGVKMCSPCASSIAYRLPWRGATEV